MSVNRVIIAAALLGSVGLAGCQSTAKALGMSKVVPDEFRIVTKAPLVVPPDYSLRPPGPGEPRPQELQPESAARDTLYSQREGQLRSRAEKMFVAKVGGNRADPLIRYVVDDEFGDITHKEKSFADRVMFWKKGDEPTGGASRSDDPDAPVDVTETRDRITRLTGDQDVLIQRNRGGIKLPGL